MNGIICIDKPVGWTSFDVVNYIRKMIARIEGKPARRVKVGHTGTLDPAATGLLVLCVGTYTKKVIDLVKTDKTYEVELTLGARSTTGDREGELSTVSSRQPTLKEVETALASFVGEIEQRPPAYSAIKIDGKRAYERARKGETFEIPSRRVIIYDITEVNYAYPTILFTAKVSSGTYIRSLAEDIGEKLGVGAYMSALKRTASGDFTLDRAYELSAVDEGVLQKTLVENS